MGGLTALGAVIVLVVVAIVFLLVAVKAAPFGHEDEDGFHYLNYPWK